MKEIWRKLEYWKKFSLIFASLGLVIWIYYNLISLQKTSINFILMFNSFFPDIIVPLIVGLFVGFVLDIINKKTNLMKSRLSRRIFIILLFLIGLAVAYYARLYALVLIAKPY